MADQEVKKKILSIEFLVNNIPKVIEGEHEVLLERLKNHHEEYVEVYNEVNAIAQDSDFFKNYGKRINMKYDELSEEDSKRLEVGVMYWFGYVFNE